MNIFGYMLKNMGWKWHAMSSLQGNITCITYLLYQANSVHFDKTYPIADHKSVLPRNPVMGNLLPLHQQL